MVLVKTNFIVLKVERKVHQEKRYPTLILNGLRLQQLATQPDLAAGVRSAASLYLTNGQESKTLFSFFFQVELGLQRCCCPLNCSFERKKKYLLSQHDHVKLEM